jgi:hypothetical protein
MGYYKRASQTTESRFGSLCTPVGYIVTQPKGLSPEAEPMWSPDLNFQFQKLLNKYIFKNKYQLQVFCYSNRKWTNMPQHYN